MNIERPTRQRRASTCPPADRILNRKNEETEIGVEYSVLDFYFHSTTPRRGSMFNPPWADKCLLAYGEFDVHLSILSCTA
jgi:hypothetical protein